MKRKNILTALLAAAIITGCVGNAPINNPATNEGNAATTATSVSEEGSLDSSVDETSALASEDSSALASTQEVFVDDVALKDLCANNFTLGVGINGSDLFNQCLNIPQYMELSKKHFNSVTMTNLMKSCYILDQAGSQANLASGNDEPALSFASIDPTLEWCQENGMKMRGHTLVWHTQAPGWFFREGYTDDGEYVDKETMSKRMESYIKQLLTHVQTEYPGVIYCWDVVNEAVEPESADPDSYFKCRTKCGQDPNPWYDTIGQGYVELAFTYARKYADKDVLLFYNDYNTYQEPKTEGIYALCSHLKEKGLIDGIGMQGYWGIDYPSIDMIKKAMTKFAELGLQIHITELSIGVDAETDAQFKKQAEVYGNVFQMLHDMDQESGGPANITNVTVFGLVDHYREGDKTNTRIFNKDYEPKPAFIKIREVMENY